MSHHENDVERRFRDATRRARRHWYDDGLAELLLGFVFLAVGAHFGLDAALGGRDRGWGLFPNLLTMVLVIAVALVARSAIRRAKERYVYPRTGFVQYPQSRRLPRWVNGLLAGATAGLTASLLRRAPGVDAWIPALLGFLLGAVLLWQGRAAGVARLTALGLVSGLAGVSVSLLALSSDAAAALLFGLLGFAALVSGALALHRYLRDAPPPEAS
jgi:hypothetical protein